MTRQEAIGLRMKAARLWAGIPAQKAAQYLGVSRTTLSAYEQGHTLPRADRLAKMAALYRTTPNILCGKRSDPTHGDEDDFYGSQ